MEAFNEFAGALESLVTVIAIVVGGYWTYARFVRQREDFPFVDFTVDISVVGKHDGNWILELIAYIENKGKVQHRLENLDFDLNMLPVGASLRPGKDFGGQTLFPVEAIRGSWLPEKFSYFFIDPGVRAKYSYITHVDESARFLMLHGWFSYTGKQRGEGHTAEKTIRLPPSREEAQ